MAGTHLDTRYKHELSPRQREVMELVARGYTNAQIAQQLGISLDGAKYHVREILAKLDVSSREEAIERWREAQARGSRLRRAWAGGFAKVGFPAVAAVAGGAAVVVVAAVVALAINAGEDDAPPAAENDPSASAAVSVVSTPTASGVADTACDPSRTSLDIELDREGDDVLVQLSANAEAPCRLAGPATLALEGSDTAFSSAVQPHANLDRVFKVALDLPVDGPIAQWRWMNWCGDRGGQGWTWHAQVGEGSQLTARTMVDVYPACVGGSAPSIAVVERFVAGVDGDVSPMPDCGNVAAGWLCQFIASLVITGPDAFDQVVANGLPMTYRCTDGGLVDGAEYSALCEGAGAGDVREGYPFERHGSEGGPVSPSELVSTLRTVSGQVARPASIGGPSEGGADWFVVALATGGSPAVTFLRFELVAGREPALVGAGGSGDDADVILGGGVTRTYAAETLFVPLPPRP